MEKVDAELILAGLFLHLNRKGFQLGVRDYQDALTALGSGYGVNSRAELLWLCTTLWARTDSERRILNLLFDALPYPSKDEVERFTYDKHVDDRAVDTRSSDVQRYSDKQNDFNKQSEELLESSEDNSIDAQIDFSNTSDTGLDIPRAIVKHTINEQFIFTPQQLISQRALQIAWRRYRYTSRVGPKTELDIDATITKKCEQGYVYEPVMTSARQNIAKVVVLVDVSSSMKPWINFIDVFVGSLDNKSNKSIQATVLYFNNVPTHYLYKEKTLTSPTALRNVLVENTSSTMLILSDAGAARGYFDVDRIDETRDFIKMIYHAIYPVTWLNPMPKQRWSNTSASKISQFVKMFELNEESLILAIDVLRGLK